MSVTYLVYMEFNPDRYFSAAPLARLYGQLAARMGESKESQDVAELPFVTDSSERCRTT